MTAREYGDPTGVLEWGTQQYVVSTSAVQYWDFPATAQISVSDIVRVIYELGRDLYDMSGGGSGCRWW
ncbi:MAG: hypothetical protein M4579_007493, partial [Chaenotheca gracillima]